MFVDNCYWLNYNVPKQLQQILILSHFYYLHLDQHLFLCFIIISLFQEITVPIYIACLFFKNSPVFGFVLINLHRRIICYNFIFFSNVHKIILNVWNTLWSMRQIKFIIPSWSRDFKFIVVIYRFNVFPCVINT